MRLLLVRINRLITSTGLLFADQFINPISYDSAAAAYI